MIFSNIELSKMFNLFEKLVLDLLIDITNKLWFDVTVKYNIPHHHLMLLNHWLKSKYLKYFVLTKEMKEELELWDI